MLHNAQDAYENSKAFLGFGKEIDPLTTNTTSYSRTSAADAFNKANMSYFSDLFKNMESVYEHLQILLFVIVGGFYISSIGANKLQTYLENRGESATNQPYLHKFYIPLLVAGTFFMPIPEANNGIAHSSLIQKTIRYFTLEGNKIADIASALGSKTYMDKIYKSVGGVNSDGIRNILKEQVSSNFIIQQGSEVYRNTCQKRYNEKLGTYNVSGVNFLTMSEKDKEDFRNQYNMDFNQISGTKNDISFESCIALEIQIREAQEQLKFLNHQIEASKSINANVLPKIQEIDTYFATRENELGWINSLITPSSAILVETFTLADDMVTEYDTEKNTKTNVKNRRASLKDGDVLAGEDDISDSYLGLLAGKLVWMILPGAGPIKDFIMDNITKITTIMGALSGSEVPIIGNVVGVILGFLTGAVASTITGYGITIYLMEITFDKVPLLVCTTASIIAFVSYLVSLCKYFYISPFVVAFSMATKRTNKIIDFLISGIAIFFKPVLIVLFIYLSLFLYTLIDEIFIFISVEQFTGIETSWYNFHTNFIVGAITGLLVIFGKLASSYLMWKLIVSGPSWALSLVGIDGKQADVIAQGLESNLAKRAFVA